MKLKENIKKKFIENIRFIFKNIPNYMNIANSEGKSVRNGKKIYNSNNIFDKKSVLIILKSLQDIFNTFRGFFSNKSNRIRTKFNTNRQKVLKNLIFFINLYNFSHLLSNNKSLSPFFRIILQNLEKINKFISSVFIKYLKKKLTFFKALYFTESLLSLRNNSSKGIKSFLLLFYPMIFANS